MSGIYIRSGDKFGKLTVRELVVDGNANRRRWLCDCECGGKKVTSEDNLRRGHCKSCGCLYKTIGGKAKYGTAFGESKTRLYRIWRGMKERCERQTSKEYARYGGRGISICDQWHEYPRFRDWALANGYSETLTLDRIDNDGDYAPDNCRWATHREQANNRGNNHKVSYNGETKNIAEWARQFGIDLLAFNAAIQRGRTVEEILKKRGVDV